MEDQGITGSSSLASDYWPDSETLSRQRSTGASGSNWWSNTNWFRDAADDISSSCAAPEGEGVGAASVSRSPSLEHVAGYADVFNRFITSPKAADATRGTAAAAAASKQRRAASALSGVSGIDRRVAKELTQSIVLPLVQPALYQALGLKPSRGVLITGHPGVGKSHLMDALTRSLKVYVQRLDGPTVISFTSIAANSSYASGSSVRNNPLSQAFDAVIQNGPALLILDDVDAVVRAREPNESVLQAKMRAVLSAEMDRLAGAAVPSKPVVVVAITNQPLPSLCPSFLRRGRFDKQITLPKPATAQRLEILQSVTREMKLAEDVDLKSLSERTEGYVAADLCALCAEAGLRCIAEASRPSSTEGSADEEEDTIMTPAELSQVRRIGLWKGGVLVGMHPEGEREVAEEEEEGKHL